MMALESSGGGVGRHVIDLCQGLSRRGHRIVLAYSPLRAEALFLSQLAELDAQVLPISMRRAVGPWDVAAANELARVVKQQGPFHIVHGHSSKAGALVRCIPTGSAKVVYTPHAFRSLDPETSAVTRRGFIFVEKMLGLLTDALIAVSQAELDFAVHHGIAPGRQRLVHNGIFHPPSTERDNVRRAMGLNTGNIVVGFVGRLTHQKAPDRFVSAMTHAFKGDSRIRAVMIGDGELRSQVLDQIAASGFSDRFMVLRGVDAKDYFSAMDLLMITSRYEGFSYVMIEALAAGVPLISTPVGGIHEAIGDDNCGIIIDDFEQTSDLSRIVLSLAGREAQLETMKGNARLRAKLFTGDKMIAETETVYQRIVPQPSAVLA